MELKVPDASGKLRIVKLWLVLVGRNPSRRLIVRVPDRRTLLSISKRS
jgi:hypothetical protein